MPMAQQEHYSQTLLPLPKIAHTFGSSVHLKPDLAHTHAPSASIAPDTQKLTHSPGNTDVTNSQAVTRQNRLVRYPPHTPGLSRNNPQGSLVLKTKFCKVIKFCN